MNENPVHISFEELADYAEGQLPAAEAVRVAAHLATNCPVCQANLDWLRQTTTLLQNDDWEGAPSASKTAVFAAYRDAYPKSSWLARWRQRPTRRWQPAFALAALAVLIIVSVVIWQRQKASASPFITLSQVNETVEIQSDDAWQTAVADSTIQVDDQLRTGPDSSALLTFSDGSTTRLNASTEIEITQASFEPQSQMRQVMFYQAIGQTYNQVEPASADSTFEIYTPAAVIAVLGTQFTVTVSIEGVTQVAVAEGQVQVTVQGETTLVSAGRTFTIDPQSPTPSPTATDTAVPSQTPTPTFTNTPSPTNTATATKTLRPTATHRPTNTPTLTATPSPSATPWPTWTSTSTSTQTPLPPTSPPPTAVPPATATQTPTFTPTATWTPTPTATSTEIPEPTFTPEPTEEPTPLPTEEPTPEPTDEPTPEPTDEPTATPTPTPQ